VVYSLSVYAVLLNFASLDVRQNVWHKVVLVQQVYHRSVMRHQMVSEDAIVAADHHYSLR
jgi:hypothetical protein